MHLHKAYKGMGVFLEELAIAWRANYYACVTCYTISVHDYSQLLMTPT